MQLRPPYGRPLPPNVPEEGLHSRELEPSQRVLDRTVAWHQSPGTESPGEAEQCAFHRRIAGYVAQCAEAWAEAGASGGYRHTAAGILPPGAPLESSSAQVARTAFPPGRMPGSTAGKMPAPTAKAEQAFHGFGAGVPPAEKLERERRADQDFAAIERFLRRWPASPAKRAAWRQELLQAMRRMAGGHLACDTEGLNQLFTAEAMEATRQFLREARAFCPTITDRSLFQALRNVWVMHSVQLLLRAPITLSPAVFAYSMLYPWTDNCLDDPQLGHAAKIAFGDWLALRLAGDKAPPPDAHCEEVGALVGRIERLYPRPEFPEVYLSLQAIHQAQMKSLDQQDVARAWDEHALLDLSIAKGGTSVLADACLVRGWLTGDEAEFMFAYGVVLQLMDDLQDLRDDLANGHMTIFTRQARLGTLDGLTSRLWAFTRQVLGSFNPFASSPSTPVVGLIQDNLRLLILQAVARSSEFYTGAFVSGLEDSSPVRFCYLARQEKTLAGRYSKVLASIRRNGRLDSVLEMLD